MRAAITQSEVFDQREPSPPHALILAAGRGSRLGGFTANQPKALVTIGEESLIGRQIRQLRAAGIERIHIVVGYQQQFLIGDLTAHFGSDGLNFIPNPDFAAAGNIVSLQCGLAGIIADSGTPELILLECDVVLEDTVLPKLLAGPTGEVALVSPRQPGMHGTVVRVAGDQIVSIITQTQQGEAGTFDECLKTVNGYRLSAEFWRPNLVPAIDYHVTQVDRDCFYEEVFARLTAESATNFAALVLPAGSWVEVDDAVDLDRARYQFAPADRLARIDEGMGGWWERGFVDFAYMTNVYFPPAELVSQLRARLGDALGNYGSSQHILDRWMAAFTGTDPARTLALPGLSAIFPILARSLDPGSVLIPSPSFGEYQRCFPEAAVYDPHLDTEVLSAEVDRTGSAVVFVVNPNNPSGALHSAQSLAALSVRHPDTLFIVDESFLPFTGCPSLAITADGWSAGNVIVMASLSKDLGLPGLRVGYAWESAPGLLDQVRHALGIWGMNSLAEVALEMLPKYQAEYAHSLRRTAVDKAAFELSLMTIDGVMILPTHANFVLAKFECVAATESAELRERLFSRGFLVKDVTERLQSSSVVLRLAVRNESDNAALVSCLSEVLPAVSQPH